VTPATSLVAVVCTLTFLHFVAAQIVGFIVAAHMAVAALASIPLGPASDVWGRRTLLLGGMATSAVTSLIRCGRRGPRRSIQRPTSGAGRAPVRVPIV